MTATLLPTQSASAFPADPVDGLERIVASLVESAPAVEGPESVELSPYEFALPPDTGPIHEVSDAMATDEGRGVT